jgi:hypothetical protein
VNAPRRSSRRARLLAAGLVLVAAALPLSSCTEVEAESAEGYEPAELHPVKGNDELVRVTFTKEGAERAGVETAEIERSGRRKTVAYSALIYDPEGKTFVYTSPKPLTYLRKPVEVARVRGDRVLLSDGPPAGTTVVTVGTAEVYGTELEVASH